MKESIKASEPKVLLIGSSGFIGTHLLRRLSPKALGIQLGRADHGAISCDITQEEEVGAAIERLRDEQFSSAIHIAGITPWSGSSPDYTLDIKMAHSTRRLCEELSIPRLVYLSGWNVYDMGSRTAPYLETGPIKPQGDYGKSKFAVEQYFKQHVGDIELVILRLGSIYGPGQLSSGLIPNMTTAALRGDELYLQNGMIRRDYLYIDDLLVALELAVSRTLSGGCMKTFNISSDQSYSIEEVMVAIKMHVERVRKTPVKIKTTPKIAPNDEIPDNHLLVKKAREAGLLGPTTDLFDGIGKYVEWRISENLL